MLLQLSLLDRRESCCFSRETRQRVEDPRLRWFNPKRCLQGGWLKYSAERGVVLVLPPVRVAHSIDGSCIGDRVRPKRVMAAIGVNRALWVRCAPLDPTTMVTIQR